MTGEQVDKCRGEGFIPLPGFIKPISGHNLYRCPFCEGATDHYASISTHGDTFGARPIHCFQTGRMAWVNMDSYIQGVLSVEEAKFRALLDKFKDAGPMTPEEACTNWHSKGLPYELAEDLSTDPALFRKLAEDHKKTGGNTFAAPYGGNAS